MIPKGLSHIKKLAVILENNQTKLTEKSKAIFMRLYEQFKVLDNQLKQYNKELEMIISQDIQCQEVMKIEGIGPITASAIVATIGDPKVFKNGREVSAWLGLTPKQYSSGDKMNLSGISKRGDRYVRKLLIHGARSIVKVCDNKIDKRNQWIQEKKYRRGYNKAAVALANKNARIIWSIMKTGECYRTAKTIN